MQPHPLMRLFAWFIIAVFGTTSTWAGQNTLADSPLVSGLAKVISPNVYFILDNSGSMNSEFMPDNTGTDWNNNKWCSRNFGYNTIYYNPSVTYDLPITADGVTTYASAVFDAAYTNGFNTGSATTDLSVATTPTYTTTAQQTLASGPITTTNGSKVVTITHIALPDGHVLAAGDRVTISGATGTGSPSRIGNIDISNFNKTLTIDSIVDATHFQVTVGGSRNGNGGSGGGAAVKVKYTYQSGFDPDYYYAVYTADPANPPSTCQADTAYTKVFPVNGTAAEKQNYANWYSYYRTRLLMMKSASGAAFAGLTDKFRVGFTVISDTGMGSSSLGIKKFSSTQRTNWYAKLYGASGTGYTPLRGALSKAGRYYAGKLSSALAGTNNDPVQYSCQQNFTILTTDGYWNTNAETSSYGPFQLNNTTQVGDVDGVTGVPRPLLDDKQIASTLADVAAYYYNTDLRPTSALGGLTDESTHVDVSTNNVPTSATDSATYQHMTTFTMGLGLDGTLKPPNKLSDNDLTALTQGTKVWPDPIASGEGPARIDDLWHAALNGHGSYFSARSPDDVKKGLGDMLQKITARKGAASAAATSNLQPVAGGDNVAFVAQYQTVTWVGDLLAREVDPSTGIISSTDIWSAQAKLDTQTSTSTDTRTIYTFSSAATNKLKSFEPANMASEISAGYFKNDQLSQYSTWSTDQKAAGTADTLIEYLRGRTGLEDSGAGGEKDLYRDRLHVLGDIASAAPVYVGKPPFSYLDTGYATFLANHKDRAGTVYVGSNDGMLHAIDGRKTGGNELWAYIPSMITKNLYRLADAAYSDNHRFFVDGPISVGDAYDGTSWATILVGGLGHGGRGYYALDVTDPANPKALWEFGTAQDSDMGYSYGNPIITKRASDGKWVVIFASGYNNSSPGDGKGRLYVIDAFSGAKLSEIITDNTVNDEQRSGIARVSNYVETGLTDNSTQYIYGGDLDGALWRFDITASSNVGASQILGRTASAGNRLQPITVQPELAKIRDGSGNWHRVVYFGTGRYLGPNDVTNSDPSNGKSQGIYAVVDTGSDIGVFTSGGAQLVEQVLDLGATPRKIDPLATVDWSTDRGWYVTTPSNERFNVDPGLQLGTLVIAANIPEQDYCNSTGKSVLYQLDYKSGNILKVTEFQEQIVGTTQLQTRGGAGPVVIDPVFGDGSTGNTTQISNVGGAGGVTRVSWREIE